MADPHTPTDDVVPDIFDMTDDSFPESDETNGDFFIPEGGSEDEDGTILLDTPEEDETQTASDLELLTQDTLDLISILDTHRDHGAEDVMAGMLRFIDSLQDAQTRVQTEMRAGQSPDALYDAMMQPLALAARFGARDLETVSVRASLAFSDLLDDPDATLTAEATADTIVWLGIAGQTLAALRVMFQLARLYGRAPNGKRLAPTP